jgi:CO/xanthine dehydrogenase Mo-binding subunit
MKHVDIAVSARDGVVNALFKLTGKRYRTLPLVTL